LDIAVFHAGVLRDTATDYTSRIIAKQKSGVGQARIRHGSGMFRWNVLIGTVQICASVT
jgi:hypothetical protein